MSQVELMQAAGHFVISLVILGYTRQNEAGRNMRLQANFDKEIDSPAGLIFIE